MRSIQGDTAMIQFTSGIFGAIAATLAFGAAHLDVAAGNGADANLQPLSFQNGNVMAGEIDRTHKGDRLNAPAAGPVGQDVTLSFRMPGEDSTSVMMRVPLATIAKSTPSAPKTNASSDKRLIACEPSVSILAPVAKQLDPARCVT